MRSNGRRCRNRRTKNTSPRRRRLARTTKSRRLTQAARHRFASLYQAVGRGKNSAVVTMCRLCVANRCGTGEKERDRSTNARTVTAVFVHLRSSALGVLRNEFVAARRLRRLLRDTVWVNTRCHSFRSLLGLNHPVLLKFMYPAPVLLSMYESACLYRRA